MYQICVDERVEMFNIIVVCGVEQWDKHLETPLLSRPEALKRVT